MTLGGCGLVAIGSRRLAAAHGGLVSNCHLARVRPAGSLLVVAALVVPALALAGGAHACVCASEPIEDRLARADAAVVGRIVGPVGRGRGSRQAAPAGGRRAAGQGRRRTRPRHQLTQLGTDCDLPDRTNASIGLLLTEEPDGTLLGTLCSIASPGPLVVAGGEPRGGTLKVLVGFVLLALVLLWSFRRLKRGARPDLPGAPRS